MLSLLRRPTPGKCEPGALLLGRVDLAFTRFSGRPAPPTPAEMPGLPDSVTREAYSREVSSSGTGPAGDLPAGRLLFLRLPRTQGVPTHRSAPRGVLQHELGKFRRPYDALRAAPNPDRRALEFLPDDL